VIVVKGWSEIEIHKIIRDFTETYKNDPETFQLTGEILLEG